MHNVNDTIKIQKEYMNGGIFMKNHRGYIRTLSIIAIIWSLAEIVLLIYTYNVSLDLDSIKGKEGVLLAYDIQQGVVLTMVLLTGIISFIATKRNRVCKFSIVVGCVSLLVSIVIPLTTRVSFNIVTIVLSLMLPIKIFQMYRKYVLENFTFHVSDFEYNRANRDNRGGDEK